MQKKIDILEVSTTEFIPTLTYEDVVRYACQFNTISLPIYSFKIGKKNRMFVIGERRNKTFISYFYDLSESAEYVLYDPSSNNSLVKEDKLNESVGKYKINIISLKKNPFKEIKISTGILPVEVSDVKNLIKVIILKATAQGYIDSLYIFNSKNRYYIGGFNLFPDEKIPSFFYCEYNLKTPTAFLKFNQKTEDLSTVDNIIDSSMFHIKLINLAAPFSFLAL